MNENEPEQQVQQERRKTPTVIVDGVEMVPKEWVDNWRKLSSERGGELARLKQSLVSYDDLDAMAERAQAWLAVYEALSEHRPGWNLANVHATGIECAVKAIRDMAEEIKTLRKKDEELARLEGMNHRQLEMMRWKHQIIDDLRKRIEELESQRVNDQECVELPDSKPTSFLDELTACLNRHSHMLDGLEYGSSAAGNVAWPRRQATSVVEQPPKPPMLWAKSKSWENTTYDKYSWAFHLPEYTNLWCWCSGRSATRCDNLIVDETKSDPEAVSRWKQDLEGLK